MIKMDLFKKIADICFFCGKQTLIHDKNHDFEKNNLIMKKYDMYFYLRCASCGKKQVIKKEEIGYIEGYNDTEKTNKLHDYF